MAVCAATMQPWSWMPFAVHRRFQRRGMVHTMAPARTDSFCTMPGKQMTSSCRCPYYSLAKGGVYGSLANTTDWSMQ